MDRAAVRRFGRKSAERVAADAGWSLARWFGDAVSAATIKTETEATIRCIPRDLPPDPGGRVVCGRPSERRVVVARAS